MWTHYLEEQRLEDRRIEALAILTANNLARILAPALGLEERGGGEQDARGGCDHEFGESGMCVFCGLTNDGGVLRYGREAPECRSHTIMNGECVNCGGREIADGLVTKGTPRVLADMSGCEHKVRFKNPGAEKPHCVECMMLLDEE